MEWVQVGYSMNTKVLLEFWVYFRSSDTIKITQLGKSLWLPSFFHTALVSKFQNTKQISKATNRVTLVLPQCFLSWLQISLILSMVLSLSIASVNFESVWAAPAKKASYVQGRREDSINRMVVVDVILQTVQMCAELKAPELFHWCLRVCKRALLCWDLQWQGDIPHFLFIEWIRQIQHILYNCKDRGICICTTSDRLSSEET